MHGCHAACVILHTARVPASIKDATSAAHSLHRLSINSLLAGVWPTSAPGADVVSNRDSQGLTLLNENYSRCIRMTGCCAGDAAPLQVSADAAQLSALKALMTAIVRSAAAGECCPAFDFFI